MVESRAGTYQGRELQERVVQINRVSKVVKGGRRFSFTALVVVGDEVENVGVGHGKANEVPIAISKAIDEARKQMVRIPRIGTTIPHEVLGHFGAGRVFLKPASEGTGVIAGAGVRAVLELGGVKDILAKCIGTRTPVNLLSATMDALAQLKRPEEVASARGMTVGQVLGERLASAAAGGHHALSASEFAEEHADDEVATNGHVADNAQASAEATTTREDAALTATTARGDGDKAQAEAEVADAVAASSPKGEIDITQGVTTPEERTEDEVKLKKGS